MEGGKKSYIAPAVTVVIFKAERGYVLSDFALFDQTESTDMTESYSVRQGWGDSETNSFWD